MAKKKKYNDKSNSKKSKTEQYPHEKWQSQYLSPQEGFQSDFISCGADIVIGGGGAGGGKTYSLLLSPLQHIKTKGFNAVIFRKTSPQIRNAGAIWDNSLEIYSKIPGAYQVESQLKWKFPDLSEIKFAHMEYENDKHNFDGSQICHLYFDEVQQFSESQFFYMMSRNRSTCGVKPCIKCTCNPDSQSWLRKFLDWWIGKDGLPIKSRAGKVRYFLRVDGQIIWGDSKNELIKKHTRYPEFLRELQDEYYALKESQKNKSELSKLKELYTKKIIKLKQEYLTDVTSVAFLPATVYDNKKLLKKNPQYLSSLKALPLVERARLLDGNWDIQNEAGKFFNSEWFIKVNESQIPKETDCIDCRYWDFASTAPKSKNKNPDYTCGIKIRKYKKSYYILDVVRVRENPAKIEQIFLKTSQRDKAIADNFGISYKVRWEMEGGSAGKHEDYRLKSLLAGYDCRGVGTGGKNKETRARPLAIQAEIGNVFVVDKDWTDTLLHELHNFCDRDLEHDDQVDALSGAFAQLTSVYIHPLGIDDIEEEEKIKEKSKENTENTENTEKMTRNLLDVQAELEDEFLSCEDEDDF